MQLASLPLETVRRFAADLSRLAKGTDTLGLAVSGGPDSVALLLLCASLHRNAENGYPNVEVISVDHGLRPESAAEARFVRSLCEWQNIDHHVAKVDWGGEPPSSNVAAKAREKRYALITDWASQNKIDVIATAHHADDQAETLLMRLARGAGLSGLTGIRSSRDLGSDRPRKLIRPLLGWRKAELEQIVADAGITPVIDPTNSEPSQDRARLRAALEQADFGDAAAFAQSASNLAEAEDALSWMTAQLVETRLTHVEKGVRIDPEGLPAELQRRLLLAGFAAMRAPHPRGPKLAEAMDALRRGTQVTLGPLLLRADHEGWHLAPAPPRKAV